MIAMIECLLVALIVVPVAYLNIWYWREWRAMMPRQRRMAAEQRDLYW